MFQIRGQFFEHHCSEPENVCGRRGTGIIPEVKWAYSATVRDAEQALRAHKTRERANGSAEMQGGTSFVKCSTSRAGSEQEARERKANAIAAHLTTSGLTALDVEAWTQAQRDAVAKRAGQRSPSQATWVLVMSKLQIRRAA